jgi:hypothetical protein
MRRAEIKECIIDIGASSATKTAAFDGNNGVKLAKVSAFRASTCALSTNAQQTFLCASLFRFWTMTMATASAVKRKVGLLQ